MYWGFFLFIRSKKMGFQGCSEGCFICKGGWKPVHGGTFHMGVSSGRDKAGTRLAPLYLAVLGVGPMTDAENGLCWELLLHLHGVPFPTSYPMFSEQIETSGSGR